MKHRTLVLSLTVLALGYVAPIMAQPSEIKLDPAQAKITTVSAMRVRRAPQVTAEEIVRLKLGTVVNASARSSNQDTIGGKTEYWYRVNLPNGETGWLFGGLLIDYSARQRQALVRQIIEARLKAENTNFADRQEIYNLAASSIVEAKDASARAEFELLKLLALANWATSFPDFGNDKSPYREWLKTHESELVLNEFAGGYNMRSELLWDLEKKYHALPIADRIAWEAAQNPLPSDCEGDEVCGFFRTVPEIKYLDLFPNGAHAVEALSNLTEALTDDVITRANAKGGDQYDVEEQAALKKELTFLRRVVTKTSAAEKSELLKRLEKVSP